MGVVFSLSAAASAFFSPSFSCISLAREPPATHARWARLAAAPWPAPPRKVASPVALIASDMTVTTMARLLAPLGPSVSGVRVPDLGRRAPIIIPDMRGEGRRARRGASLYEAENVLPPRSA